MLIAANKSCLFIFSYLFTVENGKTIMKHVYPLRRKKKIGKSKIDIDFQFSILNWKLNGRMTHGPFADFAGDKIKDHKRKVDTVARGKPRGYPSK